MGGRPARRRRKTACDSTDNPAVSTLAGPPDAPLFSILQAAGWPIWPLLACSVVALALVIERLSALRTRRVAPTRLLDDVLTATRSHPDALTGASPRGSLGLVLAARGFAVLRGRDYVIPEDVKHLRHSVLRHRMILNYEATADEVAPETIIDAVFGAVQTP